jgi:murein L,D-transpeptidase YcbB/YkuD
VQQIFPLAALVLADDKETGMDRLKKTIASGRTQNLALDQPMPLYMLYWTAVAGEDGAVAFRPDRYNRDKPLIAALT